MRVTLTDTYKRDLAIASYALWPDRGQCRIGDLTDEDRDQLIRVAAAIGSARAGEDT
jgi:hypothetical protein